MAHANAHFQKLTSYYLFPRIEKQASLLKEKTPDASLINLGIGDASLPLAPSIVKAICDAAQEMGDKKTFKGYGPSQGYLFLRELIAAHDFKNLNIHPDEIFVSDGAKCDTANILEAFDQNSIVAIPAPSYPVYVDSTVMAGRTLQGKEDGTYEGILYLPCTPDTGFLPLHPKTHADIVYLCSPNNPTGVAMTRELLKEWVQYAKKEKAILIFDAAYESYITSGAPHSIYEIEGAKDVAIEVRSYSKTAGFTGVRCSYMVIPKNIVIDNHSLHSIWKRRTDTKFGGVSYIVQKGAAAIYSPSGMREIGEQIQIYKNRAQILREGLVKLGYTVYGGEDAPYIWCQTTKGKSSWEFFDHLLHKAHIITVPGAGFGPCGEGYVRFSCFREEALLEKALNRLKKL